jgi:hypothetical protein
MSLSAEEVQVQPPGVEEHEVVVDRQVRPAPVHHRERVLEDRIGALGRAVPERAVELNPHVARREVAQIAALELHRCVDRAVDVAEVDLVEAERAEERDDELPGADVEERVRHDVDEAVLERRRRGELDLDPEP